MQTTAWGRSRRLELSIQLAAVSLAALAASFVFSAGAFPSIDLCPFHRLTGLPCAGCGMTRAFCAISHGDFAGAWGFNPFGFVLYAAFVYLALLPLLERRYPSLGARVWRRRGTRIAFTAVLCSMTVFGLWRLWQL